MNGKPMVYDVFSTIAKAQLLTEVHDGKQRTCYFIMALLAIVIRPIQLCAEVTFTPLGVFGGVESRASDVSGNGFAVVGTYSSGAFRWTALDTVLRPVTNAAAVSADGSIIAGTFNSSNGIEAFRWVTGLDLEAKPSTYLRMVR
jgi:hypothetical protein